MGDTEARFTRNSQKSRKSNRTGSIKQDGGAHESIKTNSGDSGNTVASDDLNADNDDLVFPGDKIDDKLTCKLCQDVFTQEDDKLVECEKCDRWECQSCADLTNEQYDALRTAGEKMHWFCQCCNKGAMTAVKTAELIESKCQQYVAELKVDLIDHFETKIDEKFDIQKKEITNEIRTELEEIKKEMKTQAKTLEKCNKTTDKSEVQELKKEIGHELSHELAEKNLKEIELREVKKLNIVFFNIEESTSATKEDAAREDSLKLQDLQQELETSASFKDIVRLGARNPDKPRPVKVTVSNLTEHRSILKAAKSLRKSENNSHVYISRDLTPLERESWKKLVMERKERQEESRRKNEKVKWVIYRGKVIQGRDTEATEEE